MLVVSDKRNCSGCHTCAFSCPKSCIKMVPDSEGFLYPEIDAAACIGCGKCERVCQAINPIKKSGEPQAFAAYNNCEPTRAASSSGGVFSALAEYIIGIGGTVFGAAFAGDLSVRHIEVSSAEELYRLRGSKYVQSDIGNSFIEVKRLLECGKPVLFSGTPCQCDGLLHFLGKDYDNLYIVDIVCHGAPSPAVWKKYLAYREKSGGSISAQNPPSFRNKDTGWENYSLVINYKNGEVYKQSHYSDPYMKAFISNLSLRPSCYSCHSKGISRGSDITMADFWGVGKVLPELEKGKGISLLLVSSEKGKALLESVSKKLTLTDAPLKESLAFNFCAERSAAMPKARERFFSEISESNFPQTVAKFTNQSFLKKLKGKIKSALKKVFA